MRAIGFLTVFGVVLSLSEHTKADFCEKFAESALSDQFHMEYGSSLDTVFAELFEGNYERARTLVEQKKGSFELIWNKLGLGGGTENARQEYESIKNQVRHSRFSSLKEDVRVKIAKQVFSDNWASVASSCANTEVPVRIADFCKDGEFQITIGYKPGDSQHAKSIKLTPVVSGGATRTNGSGPVQIDAFGTAVINYSRDPKRDIAVSWEADGRVTPPQGRTLAACERVVRCNQSAVDAAVAQLREDRAGLSRAKAQMISAVQALNGSALIQKFCCHNDSGPKYHWDCCDNNSCTFNGRGNEHAMQERHRNFMTLCQSVVPAALSQHLEGARNLVLDPSCDLTEINSLGAECNSLRGEIALLKSFLSKVSTCPMVTVYTPGAKWDGFGHQHQVQDAIRQFMRNWSRSVGSLSSVVGGLKDPGQCPPRFESNYRGECP